MAKIVDSYCFLDGISKLMMKHCATLGAPRQIPWTPLAKPISQCTVSVVSSAAVALKTNRPFDQEIERRDPWFSDPSYRVLPGKTATDDARVYHLHINTSFAQQDLNCVMPVERLSQLEALGEIGRSAPSHYSTDPIFGQADDSDKFIDVYPEYDFSCLARWAWAGMRAVDHLQTLPEVDKQKIAITGHSRNGKQALLAAAFDDRIAAVIASSGNTGECDPWRYTTDMFANESIEQITGVFPHWFHPRLRFFVGREHKLPVDQHALMAMVAPRGLFMYSAYAEHEGNPFGFERAFPSVEKVYRFLGHEDKVWLNLREGEHPTTAEDIEIFCDFLDTTFGRQTYPRREVWVNGYTFERWKKLSGESIDPSKFPAAGQQELAAQWSEATKQAILQKINWAMGDEPAGVRFSARHELKGSVMTDEGWISLLLGRPFKNPSMGAVGLAYGDDLKADF